ANRTFHYELYADSACHVINAVGFADEVFHQLFVEHRVDDQPKLTGAFQMFDVRITPGRKIVNDRNVMAFANKFVRKMAADKTGTACNKYFHRFKLCLPPSPNRSFRKNNRPSFSGLRPGELSVPILAKFWHVGCSAGVVSGRPAAADDVRCGHLFRSLSNLRRSQERRGGKER